MDGRGRTQEKSEVSLKKQQYFAYFFPRSAPNLLAGKARFSEILRGYWQPCITPNCIPSRRPASFWAAFHATRSTSCSDRESWPVSSSAAAGSSPGPQASGRYFTEHDLPVAPIGRAGQCRHRLPPIHLRRGDHGADHPVDDQRQPRTSLNPIVQEAPRCSPPSLTTGPSRSRAAGTQLRP